MATYEVWTITPKLGHRFVGLIDGETEGEAGAAADELYSHGNPGGLELRRQSQPVRGTATHGGEPS